MLERQRLGDDGGRGAARRGLGDDREPRAAGAGAGQGSDQGPGGGGDRGLGYVRHAGAGALASRESRLVAALVSTLGGSIFTSTIAGLGAELRDADHELLLGTTDYSPASEEALLETTLGRRPDGLVLSTDRHTERVRALLRRAKVPVVEIWQLPAQPLDMAVGFSNLAAGRAITTALVDWGYRRIGFVGALGADDHRG